MITVGLDFGTHQTKVCIEERNEFEVNYSFMKFLDSRGIEQFTLPSVISIQPDGRLRYGYLPQNDKGRVVKYFKQDTFDLQNHHKQAFYDSRLFSVWYLTYILFDLEERFGDQFSIQMGAPTDSGHLSKAKEIAVQILSKAYNLVEDLFENNKEEFLNATVDELKSVTEFDDNYGNGLYLNDKEFYQIRVFPEAYACLYPLVQNNKIFRGMSLMIDIGGGTTDMSMFTIVDGGPKVFDFCSVDKALNYLTFANPGDDYIIFDIEDLSDHFIQRRVSAYKKVIEGKVYDFYKSIVAQFNADTNFSTWRVKEALKNRPLIFTGGGSTYASLICPYGNFDDIQVVSHKVWDTKSVSEIKTIINRNLCPILSTAYGLSISRATDDIQTASLADIFSEISKYEEDTEHPMSKSYKKSKSNRTHFDSYDHGLDYDAYK